MLFSSRHRQYYNSVMVQKSRTRKIYCRKHVEVVVQRISGVFCNIVTHNNNIVCR